MSKDHPEGAVVFQHACKMGLEGIVSEAGIALPVWAFAGLAQIQESGAPAVSGRRKRTGCEAKIEDRA